MYSPPMQWPWFAIAFALYPLLHIAAANPGQVEAPSLALVAGATLVIAAVLLLLLRAALGTWLRAALGVTWFVLLFFTYGPLNAWLGGLGGVPEETLDTTTGWSDGRLQLVHSAVWALLLLLGWVMLRRLQGDGGRLPGALNLASLLLFGFALVQWLAGAGREQSLAPQETETVAFAGPRPDIYFIVLDGYSRADVLTQYYGFDNTPFLDGLRRRGFQVSDGSRSNYNWTFLSLAATLNMDFIQDLMGKALDPASGDREFVYRLLRDNRAAAFLRARGYRFIHLQSTWGGTGSNPYADEFLPCGGGVFRDDYLLAIAEGSWLRALGTSASMDIARCHLHNFDTLEALAQAPGPKFVVAHFLPPHHPYLFDRAGKVLRNASLSNQFEFQKELWEKRGLYIDQLMFVNARIAQVFDRVIAGSAVPPIILLQSDHGPSLRRGLTAAEHHSARLANLSAVRLPGAPPDLMPADATPVNLFPRVFNHYFDAGLPLRPDRRFVSQFIQPYRFVEVDRNGRRLEAAAN